MRAKYVNVHTNQHTAHRHFHEKWRPWRGGVFWSSYIQVHLVSIGINMCIIRVRIYTLEPFYYSSSTHNNPNLPALNKCLTACLNFTILITSLYYFTWNSGYREFYYTSNKYPLYRKHLLAVFWWLQLRHAYDQDPTVSPFFPFQFCLSV